MWGVFPLLKLDIFQKYLKYFLNWKIALLQYIESSRVCINRCPSQAESKRSLKTVQYLIRRYLIRDEARI